MNDSQFPCFIFEKKNKQREQQKFSPMVNEICGLKPLNGIDTLMAKWCCSLIIETFAFAIYADP